MNKKHYWLQLREIIQDDNGERRAFGNVYGRNPGEGEFANGHRIVTSPIVEIGTAYIETENSVYELLES